MDYKQVILIRTDLQLPKGKMAAQAAHASSSAVLKSEKSIVAIWNRDGMKKVILKVLDEKELLSYKSQADQLGIVNSLITDAGKTVVTPGTITCLGIGPDEEEKIDILTGKLKMM